jgi:predicted transcriptional regulator
MNIIRRSLEIDAGTDALLTEMAVRRRQDVAEVLAEAVALLDSVVEPASPDMVEDRRRLDEFLLSGEAVPLADATAWVASWDTPAELPRPSPHKIG